MAANTFYRYDTWVRSTTGPSVPGAQIYVCTQPANTVTAPPSPLAAIYSDSGGLVPITQPIITDGFGHADFYTLPGLYTVIIAIGGIIQDVLPDQSIGGVGTQGGGGGGTSGGLLLEVNGVPLSSQLQQDLVSGTGIGLTDLGNGEVQITNTSPGVVFETSGQGWFIGPGLTDLAGIFFAGREQPITNFSGNEIVTYQFTLDAEWVISHCSYQLTTTGSPSDSLNFAIYNASLQKVIDANFAGNSSAIQTVNFAAISLAPGTYYLATSATTTSLQGPGVEPGSIPAELLSLFNTNTNVICTASNSTSGGVMPATLGTLTPIVNANTWQGFPLPIWSV
jgi:hypothetical protein